MESITKVYERLSYSKQKHRFFQSQWKESEDVTWSCSQKFRFFAHTTPTERSHFHRSEWSSNEEKQSKEQIQRFKKKKKKLFHRKRTRKKTEFLRKHLFQSLRTFPKLSWILNFVPEFRDKCFLRNTFFFLVLFLWDNFFFFFLNLWICSSSLELHSEW